jgi:hypothetical protein
VSHIDEQWEADLVDMQEFSKQNKGYKYILTVIDVLSKYLWAIPLKTKTAKDIVLAFEKIFESRKPMKIRTDRGMEFKNIAFTKLLREKNIKFFTSNDVKIKCSIVERANRTLKEKMFRYFTANGTRKYIDILDKLVFSYNNRLHRSIKMKPSQVNESTEKIAYENLYGTQKLKNIIKTKRSKAHISIGSTVRKTYDLSNFDKGYYPNWTDQTYKIHDILRRPQKIQYIIKNFENNLEKRRFYPEEIQRISSETPYRIEKVIKKRKNNGRIEFYVKWLNYPQSENSWISMKELMMLKRRN